MDEVAAALGGFGYGEGRLPAEDRPARRLVAAADRLRLQTKVCDPDRDWRAAGALLSPVLWLLWNRPAFREAAKGGATS